MNRFILFMVLLSGIILLFSLAGCEGPAGPQGSLGDKGEDVAFESCGFSHDYFLRCHGSSDTTYYVAARKYQWESSVHATGGRSFENGTSCQECHTTEGYIRKQNGWPIWTTQNESTPLRCESCHSPHEKGDFSLRTETPQTLLSNITGVTNYTFDYGKGNLCASCHHPRSQSTKLNIANVASTTDSIVITSRWYGHYGVQGQILAGQGGYEWPGYDYTPNLHATMSLLKTEGCTQCHMPPATGNLGGGHTMILEYTNEGTLSQMKAGCLVSGCHSGTFTFDFAGTVGGRTVIQKNLDTLKLLLAAKGWIDTVANTPKAVTVKPSNKAGAVWNYFLVEHDGSTGIHNAKYANALLRASITEIRKP